MDSVMQEELEKRRTINVLCFNVCADPEDLHTRSTRRGTAFLHSSVLTNGSLLLTDPP